MSIAVQANQDAAPARCSIGYLYHAQSARLLRFDRFLQGRPEPAGQAPKVLLQQWTAQGRTLDDAWECEQTGGIGREFAPETIASYQQQKSNYVMA